MSNYVVTTIDPDFTPETFTIGATSAQSSAIITQSGIVRIAVTGTHAHIKFGSNPTATEDDIIVTQDSVNYFTFKSGDKIAFIKSGDGSGQINICAVD
jgi:transcription termination factor Rho